MQQTAAKTDAQKSVSRAEYVSSLPTRVGEHMLEFFATAKETLSFIGDLVLAAGLVLRKKAHFRKSDFKVILQECGVDALPIVSLICFLVGAILAFIGAVQLEKFGAQIYVANLVGVGMTREMAPMMTAIIMAGRTGAAFAAHLGVMQVNEEVDAFKTLAISPIVFLILPRILALTLMLPLLCLYTDLMGILGGATIGIGMLNLSVIEYVNQTHASIGFADIAVGLVKSVVFGLLIAAAGCFYGIRCGRNSAAVGAVTTSAVVSGIVFVIVVDAVFAVVTNILGI